MNINVKEIFIDWKELNPGEWSSHPIILRYGKGKWDYIEIGLYREPMEGNDYPGTYTLQTFNGEYTIDCEYNIKLN